MQSKITRNIAVMMALGLAAVACVDESADDGADKTTVATDAPSASPDSTTPETAVADSGSEEDEVPTGAAEQGDAEVADEPSPEPEVAAAPLTASDIGVTESSITVGIPALDLDALREFGLLLDSPELDDLAAWESAIASVNDRGGINGRTLEAVYSTFLPLGQAEADAACVDLVQDNEIFAALGSLIVPEGVLCFTELNGTPFVGTVGQLPDAIVERGTELALSTTASTEAIRIAMMDYAENQGDLDRPVAVHGLDQPSIEAAVEELESRGVDVVSITTVSAPASDQAARLGEFEQIFERWRSDGAEVVINVGSVLDILAAMGRQEIYFDIYTADDTAYQYRPEEPREIAAAERVTMVSGAAEVGDDHQPTLDCIAGWDRDNPDRLYADTVDQHGTVEAICAAVELFAAVAEAAGPELTHESYTAAAESIGAVDLAGAGEVTVTGDNAGPVRAAVRQWSGAEDTYVQVDTVEIN